MMLLGGPMANVAFILVLSILLRILSRRGLAVTQQNLVWFLPFTRWANVFQLIAAAIPLKFSIWPVKNYVSDGMRILLKAREPRKD